MSNDLIKQESRELINQIIEEKDPAKLENLTNMFRQTQLKKSIIRADKLSDAISLLDDEMIQRLQLEPESISNKDIIAYMNATQNAMNAVNQSVNNIPAAVVQVNNIEVNNQDPFGLSAASRQNVLNALAGILGNNSAAEFDNIIDLDTEEKN